MKYCSECGQPLKVLAWGLTPGQGTLMACDCCRSVFMEYPVGSPINEAGPAWQKQPFALDQYSAEYEKNKNKPRY